MATARDQGEEGRVLKTFLDHTTEAALQAALAGVKTARELDMPRIRWLSAVMPREQ